MKEILRKIEQEYGLEDGELDRFNEEGENKNVKRRTNWIC